jgi:hypothetical protein
MTSPKTLITLWFLLNGRATRWLGNAAATALMIPVLFDHARRLPGVVNAKIART